MFLDVVKISAAAYAASRPAARNRLHKRGKMARAKRTTADPREAGRNSSRHPAPRMAPRVAGRLKPKNYHHGDLRAALLAAAEEELAEKGVEGFTLRGCARRAGVSHAAPAHHFKDVRALLTEMATAAFEGLSASMDAQAQGASVGSLDYLAAIGRGYILFAAAQPQQFRLMWRTAILDRSDERFRAAADKAFAYPVRAVGAYRGSDDPMSEPRLATEVIGIWSMVHGLADLMLAGQFDKRAAGEPAALADSLVAPLVRQFFVGTPAPAHQKDR